MEFRGAARASKALAAACCRTDLAAMVGTIHAADYAAKIHSVKPNPLILQ
jgi:hypothetical protein